MKFLCLACDVVMEFTERQLPGDGTFTAVFRCVACQREIALLANQMETQLVSGLGVKVGGRTIPEQPLEVTMAALAEGRPDAFQDEAAPLRVVWTTEATDRLNHVPSFVRGMVKRIYSDYARERSIAQVTPDVMDRARSDLGLEGM